MDGCHSLLANPPKAKCLKALEQRAWAMCNMRYIGGMCAALKRSQTAHSSVRSVCNLIGLKCGWELTHTRAEVNDVSRRCGIKISTLGAGLSFIHASYVYPVSLPAGVLGRTVQAFELIWAACKHATHSWAPDRPTDRPTSAQRRNTPKVGNMELKDGEKLNWTDTWA